MDLGVLLKLSGVALASSLCSPNISLPFPKCHYLGSPQLMVIPRRWRALGTFRYYAEDYSKLTALFSNYTHFIQLMSLYPPSRLD